MAAAQDAPVFLDPTATTERIVSRMRGAAREGGSQKPAFAAADVDAAVRLDGPELACITAAAQELELDAALRERHNLDVAGHYHRPDVFRFEVDRSRREPLNFADEVQP